MARSVAAPLRVLSVLVLSAPFAVVFACPSGESPAGDGYDGGKSGEADAGSGDQDGGPEPTDGARADAGVDLGPTFRAAIAPIPDVLIGFDAELDSSPSENPEGRALTIAWEVRSPGGQGCEGTVEDSGSPATRFTPGCLGEHMAVLTLTAVNGERSTAELAFRVRNDHSFQAAIAPIGDVFFGDEATLDGTPSQNPEELPLTYLWEVRTPTGEDCGGELFDEREEVARFVPSCRGEHTAVYTLATLNEQFSVDEKTFLVRNNPPTLSGLALEAEFDVGGVAVLSAEVEDFEQDATTCTIRVAASNTGDTDALVLPAGPAADCRFEVATPPRLESWTLEVVASDGEDESMPATIQIAPGNNPPTLDALDLDVTSVGYACDDAGCTSNPVRVTITASDDVDAAAELIYAIEDVSSDTPAGTRLEATPVAGEPGAFDVVVRRDTRGPMGSSWALRASVTEVTASAPASATLEAEFGVVSQAPFFADVEVVDVLHSYDATNEHFLATLELSFEASDPEDNLLTTNATVLSCPGGAFGTASCGGANLEVVQTPGEGTLRVELSASDLAVLVGPYTLSLRVQDADGTTSSVERTAAVLNTPPQRVPGAPTALSQRFVSGAHQAAVPFLRDADGDPVSVDLTVTCPDGSTTPMNGACSSGQTVSLAADGTLTIRGPASAGFLGLYTIAGSATDGAASTVLDETIRVTNAAPQITIESELSISCDHRTVGTTVSAESSCPLAFTVTVEDANDDPIALIAEDLADAFTIDFGPAASGGTQLSRTFTVSASLADFIAAFDANQQAASTSARFTVEDPFGDGPTPSTVTVRLRNRAPTATLASDVAQQCHHRTSDDVVSNVTSCSFELTSSAVDPDGDPLDLALSSQTPDVILTAGDLERSAGQLSVDFSLSLALDEFIAAFDVTDGYAAFGAQARVSDPFGAGPGPFSMSARLLNREPVAALDSNQTVVCHHRTASGQVSNENGCQFQYRFIATDPDNDPLTLSLEDLADDFTLSSPTVAQSGPSHTLTFDASASLEDFVDAFDSTFGSAMTEGRIRLSDPLDAGPAPFLVGAALLNRAPTGTVASASTQSCHHRTSGGTVTNDSGCEYEIRVNATDPDGDPMSLSGSDPAPSDGFTLSFESSQTSGTTRSMSFGVSTAYTNFVDGFTADASATTARFELRDAIGMAATTAYTVTARLLNRAPTASTFEFRNAAGSGSPDLLPNSIFDITTLEHTGTARRLQVCVGFGCRAVDPYLLSLVVGATDPDGDPMDAEVDITCNGGNAIRRAGGASLSTFQALPSNGRIDLELQGSETGICAGGSPAYREWTVTATTGGCNQFGICSFGNHAVTCTLNRAGSSVQDDLATSTFGSGTVSVQVRPDLEVTSGLTCN